MTASPITCHQSLRRSLMPSSKRPAQPRSTEDILREMENVSKGIGPETEDSESSVHRGESHGGALKSLLTFFVKVVPEEEVNETPRSSAPPPPAKTNAPPP